MAREQVAGAIILDTLRERIVSGLYVGHWRPGERLPSIRKIAEAENVDRKTAAAAYHRLEEEGLVRVRPRSGVYLCAPRPPASPGPLERLHRQWLQHTFEGARSLGLDTGNILRLVGAVAELEQVRLPVIECNWPQAEAIAAELRRRLSVQAMPYLLEELRPGDPIISESPVLVTTPYHAADLALLASGRLVIEATLAPELLREILTFARTRRVLIFVAEERQAAKLGRAFTLGPFVRGAPRVRILASTRRETVTAEAMHAERVYLWPGAPDWVEGAIPAGIETVRPRPYLSESSMQRIQTALLDAALRRTREVSRSIGAAVPR